jgi:hypothetical protein
MFTELHNAENANAAYRDDTRFACLSAKHPFQPLRCGMFPLSLANTAIEHVIAMMI